MSKEESPGSAEPGSIPVTPSSSRSVTGIPRKNSTLTDTAKNTLESRSTKSKAKVWVPDTSGKYVSHRSRPEQTEEENNRLAKTSMEYDPYRHRNIISSIGNCFALLHLMKGNIGNGIFQMPGGYRIGGLLTGTIATAIMAALFSYSFNLLMKTIYLLCKRKRVPYLAYGDAMLFAMEEGPDWMIQYSKTFKTFTNVAIVLRQVGTLCNYMNSVSNSVKGVIDDFHCDVLSLQAMMSALAILFFLIICVPNLQKFGYFTAVAMTLAMICLSMVSYTIFTDVQVQELRPSVLGTPTEWNKFVDIVMFAMVSPGLIISTEHHMTRPQDYIGVFGMINLSIMISALLYWYLGFSGYYIYGEETKIHIFNNLPKNEVLTRAVVIIQAISILISFGLQAFPAFDVLWDDYLLPRMTYTSTRMKHFYNYALRAVVFLLAYVITMTIVYYISFILSVIVVVNMALLGFGFPAIMQICYLWPDNFGKRNWIYYKDLAMCAFSLAIMAVSVYNATDAVIHFQSAPASTCSSTSQSANDTS